MSNHRHLRLALLAAALTAPLCGLAEPLIASPAPAAKETSPRDALRAISPINYEVLRRMEFRAGRELATPEWLLAMQTPAFATERLTVQYEFCEQPRNARVLACEAVQSRRMGDGTGKAPALNGWREYHSQDAAASEGCSATRASATPSSCPGQ